MSFERLTPACLSAKPELKSAVLELNNLNAEALSWLDEANFSHLVEHAFLALAHPQGHALLIAFDQNADYDSPNFTWFKNRFDKFVYVDRIVVGKAARGQNLARSLYEELFARALADDHTRVTCEVNEEPPNPGSDAFHAAMGFCKIGQAALSNGKHVRYFERPLRQ